MHSWGVILLLTRNLVESKIIGLSTIKDTVINSPFLTVGYRFAFDIYLGLLMMSTMVREITAEQSSERSDHLELSSLTNNGCPLRRTLP
jgi:hypothetical protein